MKKATRPGQGLGLTYTGGRPRAEDVLTRRKMSFWDRSKWLVLLVVIWLLLVWSLMADNPLVGFLDACRIEVRTAGGSSSFSGLELIHQLHFFISERSAAYNQFWVKNVWGKWARFSERNISAWAKFRISRVIKWIVVIAVIAIIMQMRSSRGAAVRAAADPAIVWSAMPFVVQIVFTLFFVVAQFGHAVLVPVQGRRRRLLPGRHQDQVLRRVGPGPRARAGQGEHHLP